jgi:hypothetical protein
MSRSGRGFFNRFPLWGGGGGGDGHQGGGTGRGGNHPHCQLLRPGEARGWVSFKEAAVYDLADDGRDYYGRDIPYPNNYSLRHSYSDAGYEAHRKLIFQLDGAAPPRTGTHP